jgi:Reverse transcriptase (RNA-dependent DNA polymerase)
LGGEEMLGYIPYGYIAIWNISQQDSGGSMPPMGATGSDNLEPKQKRKQNEIEDDIDINAPRKTCGIHIDYKTLHDPFTTFMEEEEENFLSMEEAFAIIAGDELTSLKEAKESLEWPDWERAMQEQLDLLKEMGTWEIVQKPLDAVLIANKWVFIKKQNKQGEVVRHKARLVIKGYA